MLELIKSMPPFVTCARFNKDMNQVEFYNEDVPYYSENDPTTLIQLLQAFDDDRVIGFKIENPLTWVKHCKNETD